MAIRAFFWSACAIALLTAADCNAGTETLDSLIRAALENNRDLMAADNRYQSMKYEAEAAGVLPDPKISLSAMNLPRKSLSLTGMDMSGISVGVSQGIPWPSRLSSVSRIAKYKAEMESANSNSVRNSIVRQVRHNYYEYSYWVFAINLLNENIGLSENIIDFVETRYANGQSSIEEVISARVSKNEMENRRLHFESVKQSALYRIRQLVHDSTISDQALSPFLTFKLGDFPAERPDYSGSPALKGASSRYQVARAKHSLAKSEYWPELMIGADYMIRKQDASRMSAGPVSPGEDLLSFHLGFSIPLWFFAKQKKMTKATKFGIESAQAEQQLVDIQLKQSIKEAQVDLRTLRERINQFVDAIIPLNEAAYEAAYVAYEVGQIDFKSLLADQINLYNSKLDHIALVKNYHQTRAYLDELIGREYGE